MAGITLSEEQRAVLAHDRDRPARVLAGTGKSATLVALIAEMVKEKPQPRVRLLMFTRAATAELANKLEDHPSAIVQRPSTIHSFAISVLLRNGSVENLPRPLRIADDWERYEIVRPSLARRADVGVYRLDDLLRELAANWESLRPHEEPEIEPAERARFIGCVAGTPRDLRIHAPVRAAVRPAWRASGSPGPEGRELRRFARG